MPIFAQPSNSIVNVTLLTQPFTDGQSLVYDNNTGYFINKKLTVDLTGAVTSARSVGGENALSVFKSKTTDGILEFNNILPGPGIDIRLDNFNNIVFSVDSTAATVSVSENYTIIIDNDGNNTEAIFEIKTVSNLSAQQIRVSALMPLSANNLFTGNSSGRGFIESINDVDFELLGYKSDMIITLTGTPDQDGVYIIDEVKNITISAGTISTIYFIDEFTGDAAFSLGGPKYPTTIAQGSIWIPDNNDQYGIGYSSDRLYSLQFWGVDLGPSGHNLQPDMIISIVGTEDGIIDGTYRIAQVNSLGPNPAVLWSGIIFHPSTPLPAGLEPGLVFDNDCCNNQIRIIVHQYIKPTGFSVNTSGVVTASSVEVNNPPTMIYELANKGYVDNSILNAINNLDNTELSAINVAISELQNQVNKLKKLKGKPLRYYLGHAKW